MNILSKYLIKEFVKLLTLCEIVFIFLYLIIEFLQKIDNFIEAQVPKGVMLLYFLFKAPLVAAQMIPPATLIAVIVMFATMKRRNEITALKASGLNLTGVSLKVIVASFFVAVALFLFSETVVPYASFRSNRIWDIDVEKQDPGLFYGSHQIWYKGSDSIYWIRDFDFKNNLMHDPTFYFFDESFRLIKRIDGRLGVWKDGKWVVEGGIVQELSPGGGYDLKKLESQPLEIPEGPEAFVKGMKKPEEMSYWQLKRYAETVQKEGYDNTRYLVDMNLKIAFPFVGMVLVFVGIPLPLGLKKGNTPLAISLGMAICFGYVLILGFSRSLGLSGVLPPLLSAWLANLLFLLLG
ncbi:MAG: LptF/LptG family permease, partial [Desulfobacterales bacterium]|nr:LptF/LptG family permease [Desulfobacterales bacterium]